VPVGSGRPPSRDDGAAETVSVVATAPSFAAAAFYLPLVHDWALPVEILPNSMPSKPLFLELTDMLRLWHVSVEQHELLGSIACNQLYEEGVERTMVLVSDGDRASIVKFGKTDKMKSTIKNRANRYGKVIFWLPAARDTAMSVAAYGDTSCHGLESDRVLVL